ncbi:hypothetical protein H072_9326 [Dactylellina haptotyla CBS 200.50]|uniref:DUF1868 domain-containing protein n=1 Tax=Dactylellina haptotyla (strain CBS 200.50) TaxID=1284197 RepID=S8BPD6_DACHA|nr:hypothetical protein H072_9326 [Dactylellina haptotyla CBS 200.50]
MAIRPKPTAVFLLLVASFIIYVFYPYQMSSPEVFKGPVSDERFDPNRPYPIGVPSKFDVDGKVQPYAGCTVTSPLSSSSELHVSLVSLYEKLAASHLSNLYALLPTTSWHMTVFEGLTNPERDYWPKYLKDKSMDEVVAIFKSKLENFDLQCELPFRLSVVGFDPLQKAGVWYGIGLTIVGRSDGELVRIKALRDRLSDALGYQMPWHQSYGLHISMGYLIRKLTEVQEKELRSLVMDHFATMSKDFELEVVEFSTFKDMFAFEPLIPLKNKTI